MTSIGISPVGPVILIEDTGPGSAATLPDYAFELDGYVFGARGDVILDGVGAFDTGTAGISSQDANLSQEDGTRFGRDTLSGPTWAWSLGVNKATPAQALAELERFAKVWRADSLRETPGAVLPLRYTVGGRTRRVYGRPRRYAAPPENRILSGWIPITVDFQCADHLHYDEAVNSTSVTVAPPTSGGFTTPLISPITTMDTRGSREGMAVVGGTAPTWVTVTFTGPVTNPVLQLAGGWEVGLQLDLAQGESVTVDAHPWARTAMRGESSVGGTLSRRTRMTLMKLAPGVHSFTYRGLDTTGTSRATVAWRNASHSL